MPKATSGYISRGSLLPVVISLNLILLLASITCVLKANSDFHHFTQLFAERHQDLPALSEAYRHVYPFGLLLPVFSVAWAMCIVTKSEASTTVAAWYMSVAVLSLVVWVLVTFVALDLMHIATTRLL